MPIDVERVRAQFPSLAVRDAGRARIYLDNPSGTQVPKHTIDRITHHLTHDNSNASMPFATSIASTRVAHDAHVAMADFLNAASEREIVIGPNMTTLAFTFSRSLAHRFEPGDEIILSRMDHDGNVRPWEIMAEERGLVVKRLDFDPATYQFDPTALPRLIGPRTRFAAFGYASNMLGTVNDVKAMCTTLRAAGVLTWIDAVQYAPHGAIDVASLGCDFLVCSTYKFFAPHLGVLWAREALLDELKPYKLRASDTTLPGRFETGTPSFEAMAGLLGTIDYLEWVGRTMGEEHHDRFGTLAPRRRWLHAAMTAIGDYESGLARHLIAGLEAMDGVCIRGISDPQQLHKRAPTVSITANGIDPAAAARTLGDRGIFATHGHCYALHPIERLGLMAQGGVLRFGPAHYNTVAELDTTLMATAEILREKA
jgi:cysteine desulfurase family protein (TIGR01976 family)